MQYDWPADQWSPGRTFSLYSLVPLPWDADLSFRIAARWRRAFFGALSSRLRFYPRTHVTAIVPVGGPPPSELKVHFQSPNLTTSKFQLVIWAAGFGEEICSIRDERHGTGTVQHTGPVFWSSDSLEEVLADYPDLEPADIQQALKYGAWLAQEEVVPGY
jgi:hypothetical protein